MKKSYYYDQWLHIIDFCKSIDLAHKIYDHIYGYSQSKKIEIDFTEEEILDIEKTVGVEYANGGN
jgi:hypothetical protein